MITRYESSTGPYRTEWIRNPKWQDVEHAIRALDRDLLPFVWMYHDPNPDPDNDLPDFDITGGDGAYYFAIRGDGYELTFTDESRGDEEVDVWISDQGASFPAFNVCPDVKIAIDAARSFYEDGSPCDSVPWGPY